MGEDEVAHTGGMPRAERTTTAARSFVAEEEAYKLANWGKA